ncbi:MAG: IS5 family transposase [Betaproteobacteria bacterium]|nr:IS5 family transposase [Betaproteobacteria bacterium]
MEVNKLAARYAKLDIQGDPLVHLNEVIPWERFRSTLQKALKTLKKSEAGRKPYDYVMMFKLLVLQALYNLSDAQAEYQVRDRLSFIRFLKLSLDEEVPDEKTIWLYRERLKAAQVLEKLFEQFNGYLNSHGFQAKCGTLVDASIVEVPKQRNSREENKEIKAGKSPEDWANQPEKQRQKDVEARWTKKNNQNYYGYKNHVNVDVMYKFIRKFIVTPASQGDITCLEALLTEGNTDNDVWADKAYRSDATENMLKAKGYTSRIHYKGFISPSEKRWNYRYSKIRARVEHVFGFITNSMKGNFIRTVGLARAEFKIGMNNLVYNFCRYSHYARA